MSARLMVIVISPSSTGIVGLELVRLDEQLVRHEPDESAEVRIGTTSVFPTRSAAS
jgi:hypothetical protein